MKIKKKIITQIGDVEEFERKINLYEGFATQTHVTAVAGVLHYTAIIFIKVKE